MSAYQRNTATPSSRRTQRPSSFSGTRSRNVYSSTTPSYAYGSTSSWSPSPTYGLTTYGGTTSGYGGLTVPNPNSYQSHGYSSYLNNISNRASSPSYSPRSSFASYSPNSISKSTSFDFNLKRPASSSSLSLRSTGSEGYASGNEKSGRSSRLSSTSSVQDEELTNQCNSASSPNENGELDYKKLYEETLVENERLREKLRKTEDDLTECKLRLTDSSSSTQINKNSLSEIEKREKRAMERKLSEMEEELKQLQKLKAENERLRAENRALTRVVSKLTTSANAVK